MRLEKALDRRFFGYRSILGWNHWRRAVKKTLTMKGGCGLRDRIWCLKNGFTPDELNLYGPENLKKNHKDYLSIRDYYRLHPINGPYSFWVDDKLTMKYMLSAFDRYLPQYYFQIEGRRIMRLPDADEKYTADPEGIMNLLKDKGDLAAKRMWGSGGLGFYRLAYSGGQYFVNGKAYGPDEMSKLLAGLGAYLITEFIVNHKTIRDIWPDSTNTIRVLIANLDGRLVLLRSFIRFGNAKSNCVDNAHAGGIESVIDEDTGRILKTYRQDEKGRAVMITEHPDSGESFDIQIPHWDEVIAAIREICAHYPQLRYLGFDIAVTEDSFRIIEINSLSGLHAAQMKEPLLRDPKTREAYRFFGLKAGK